MVRIARGNEALVIHFAEQFAGGREGVVDVDHQRLPLERLQRLLDDARELAVGDQNLGLAMFQDEADHRRIEPDVERIEHGAGHGDAEMRLEGLGRVGRHQRHRVVLGHPGPAERARQAPAAPVALGPAVAAPARHHRQRVREHWGAAGDESERRQRHVIGRIAVEIDAVRAAHLRHFTLPDGPAWQRPGLAALFTRGHRYLIRICRTMTSRYAEAHRRSLADPESFWGEAAPAIDWEHRGDRVLDADNPPFYRWFPGGRLNTCHNALDRHVARGPGPPTALIYDNPVSGQTQGLTYRPLRD